MRFCLQIALFAILEAGPAVSQPVRRDYYDGDWVSFITQRDITGFAQGFEVLYIGTPNGVGRYSTMTNRFLLPLTASSGLDNPRVLRIAFDDGSGTLWIDTPLGPASYNEAIHEWRRGGTFPDNLSRDDAAQLRFDNLFTPFDLSYFTPDRQSPYGFFRDRNLRTYPITTALVDGFNRSRIWFGAWGQGLGDVDNVTQQVTFHPWGLYQSTVYTLLQVDKRWYFAGEGDGSEPPLISVFDTGDSTWSYLEPFYRIAAAGAVTSTARLGRELFFGTADGLLKYDPRAERWRRYSRFDGLPEDRITAVFPDGELLWVGTSAGPGLVDPCLDTGRVAVSMITASLPATWVYDFASAWGYIWAGTEKGLYRIRQREADWSRITTPDGLLRGRVRALEVRPEGIWCATDGGLLLLDSNLAASRVFRSGGDLANGNLFALAVDDANIWAAGQGGLWRYIRAKDRWRVYTRSDGLLDDFVFDLALDGDYIWLAGREGVTRFFWNNRLRID
jgi:ligand-binding sensor domain-containing protein